MIFTCTCATVNSGAVMSSVSRSTRSPAHCCDNWAFSETNTFAAAAEDAATEAAAAAGPDDGAAEAVAASSASACPSHPSINRPSWRRSCNCAWSRAASEGAAAAEPASSSDKPQQERWILVRREGREEIGREIIPTRMQALLPPRRAPRH
jgi:hypothetical protein